MPGVLIRRGDLDTDKGTEERPCDDREKVGTLQAKERVLEQILSLRASEGTNPASTLILNI